VGRGVDVLQSSSRFDIPRVDNIPVVSELVKTLKKGEKPEITLEQKLKDTKSQVNKVIDGNDEELETHFVENPFIRLR